MSNYITTISWGDDDYQMPSMELGALVAMADRLEAKGGDDCIVLYCILVRVQCNECHEG